MLKNTRVQGTVRRPEVNKDYTGLPTETAEVIVNNIDRTISVDVNFSGMLGETHKTAYPGNSGALNRSKILKLEQDLPAEITRAKSVEQDIQHRLAVEYATKQFVETTINDYNKLSKQIADSVDIEKNTVTINGVEESPKAGIIYLVPDESQTGESTYKQYSTILVNDVLQLTLIGDTKIDLSDYATKAFVHAEIDAIPEVDLSPYAKSADLPNFSEFLTDVPSEFITETELAPYATKSYVQSEIAKVGSLSKIIAESINIEEATVVVKGVVTNIQEGIVYLVPSKDVSGEYEQYTVIDDEVTYIGNTAVDLQGYATTKYVDDAIKIATNSFNKLLTGLKFIDGGTSSNVQSL